MPSFFKEKKQKKENYFRVLLLAFVLLLLSCQSIPEQAEKTELQETVVAQQPVYSSTIDSFPDKAVSGNAEAKFSQSVPPMSIGTKKRLKAHAQELMSHGTMPRFNYQQPESPGLHISPDVPQQDTETAIKFDYEQVEIRNILEEFADSLNLSIIIDSSLSGKVTMRTAPNATLTKKDLWPLLQMILNEAGVVLERRGDIYYAKQTSQLLPPSIGPASILRTTDASRIMQITPLKHISIDAAMAVLKPVAGAEGSILPIETLNTLLIVDSPEKIKRFNALLSLIDSDPFKNRGIQLYKIKKAEAKVIAQELKEILALIEGNKPVYQVMGLERINALLVVAPPGRGFKEVSRWVDILDSGADDALIEQVFIYRCKSLQATSLAATLNAVFQQDNNTPVNEQNDFNNDPNEFRAVPKESLSVEALRRKNTGEDKKTVNNNGSFSEVSSANINVTIVADEDSNTLLVRTTAKDYKQLLETIRVLDIVPLQVLINVVIAQVTLNDSQSFGIDWAYLGSAGTTLQTNFNQATAVTEGDPLGLIINRITGNWRVTLNALAKESDVNILSRPSLLITDNQEGVINVGKEVPVEISNTTNTNSTGDEGGTNVTQQIAYRKTGIELTVTPQINEDGIVNMVIKQGLSAIEGQTSGADVGLNPTFTNQEINTTVVVRDKETIILGGLIESVEVDSESGVPVLKDVPLVGNLFKSQGTQVERRELILIISTNILNVEGDYDAFNNAFKSRYYAAADYLDEQLSDNKGKKHLLNKDNNYLND